MSVDHSGRPVEAGQNDAVFIHAELRDAEGTLVPLSEGSVRFSIQGEGRLIGNNPASLRAGVASLLYQAGDNPGQVQVSADDDALALVVTPAPRIAEAEDS